MGDRQILEKPIPEIIENAKVRVIVEKKIRNWQIIQTVEIAIECDKPWVNPIKRSLVLKD